MALSVLAGGAAIGVVASIPPAAVWLLIGKWPRIRWLTLAAVLLASAAIVLARRGRPVPVPVPPGSVVWEAQPGQVGLVARTMTASPPGVPSAEPMAQRWNWPAVNSVITAFTAVGALVFTALSLTATRDQVSVAEQGEVTDRYTTAVDQISTPGLDHLETRLGGIYALERLAIDSHRDQPTIIQVLGAFIRTNTPVPTSARGPSACPVRSVALDVQAALTVLGRRDPVHDFAARIDLSNTCLRGADLSGAHFVGAYLSNAHLDGAYIADAHLDGASLGGASLDDANLVGADLTGTYLVSANLTQAFLGDANLNAALLNSADLIGADLNGAYLYRAHLPLHWLRRHGTPAKLGG